MDMCHAVCVVHCIKLIPLCLVNWLFDCLSATVLNRFSLLNF